MEYFNQISDEKISSLISLFVALVVVISSFFQWWYVTFDGGMITHFWVKILLLVCAILLCIAIILII